MAYLGSCLELLIRLELRCQPGLESSEGMTGVRGSHAKVAHPMVSKLVLVVGISSPCGSLWRLREGDLTPR